MQSLIDTGGPWQEARLIGNCLCLLGDNAEILPTLPTYFFDAIVTDPPAGIGFMNLEWDRDKGGRDAWIQWMQEVADQHIRACKPGAHALVWSLPRTSHWTATAWENANWTIRDRVSHCFSQGFPKSLDISRAIDQKFGHVREVVGRYVRPDGSQRHNTEKHEGSSFQCGSNDKDITAPVSEFAQRYAGFGTNLKPAIEDWWLFRAPLSEKTIIDNVLKWGTAGLNIDACRIPTEDYLACPAASKSSKNCPGGAFGNPLAKGRPIVGIFNQQTLGRFPSHLIHDGSEEVLSCFPDAPGQLADISETAPSPKTSGIYGPMKRQGELSQDSENQGAVGFHMKPGTRRLDSGSAARFFYCAKSSSRERGKDNIHPTVKPLALMKYLITLVTPPHGILLDPFMGSGSTLVAATMLGVSAVGIEQDPGYYKIACHRIEEAIEKQRDLFTPQKQETSHINLYEQEN